MPTPLRALATGFAAAGLITTAALAGNGAASPPAASSTSVSTPATTTLAVAGSPATTVTYDWPVPDPVVTAPFDAPAQPWLSGHRGVDLASVAGTPVLAAAEGTVAFAGQVAGRGVVSIDHADGIRTTYEPVAATVLAGQRVARGESLGTLLAGHGSGVSLHWGARTGPRTYIDPTLLVRPAAVIRLWE